MSGHESCDHTAYECLAEGAPVDVDPDGFAARIRAMVAERFAAVRDPELGGAQ